MQLLCFILTDMGQRKGQRAKGQHATKHVLLEISFATAKVPMTCEDSVSCTFN